MPKYLVTMNVVEAKTTSFVIVADNEDDVHDGLGELDFSYFEKNCDWTTSEFEPPVIEKMTETKKNKGFTKGVKNQRIQKRFNKIINAFNKMEKISDE